MNKSPVEMYNEDPKWVADHPAWLRHRQQGHPTHRPDFLGISGFAWNIPLTEDSVEHGALASIMIEAPWYSPIFQVYLLTCMLVENRILEDMEVSHEFYIHQVLPATPIPDITSPAIPEAEGFHYNDQPQQFLQLPLPDDATGLRIAGVLAQQCVDGYLNPDARFADSWAIAINQCVDTMGTLQ